MTDHAHNGGAPGRPRSGRPGKLTPARQARICEVIRSGNSEEAAALVAGVSRATLFSWLSRGRRAEEALLRGQSGEMGDGWSEAAEERRYRLFSAAVSRAVAESEVALVRRVKEADDWRASAWMLERRFQDRWRRRDHVEVSGEGHALPPVPAGRVVVEDPVARELARKLRERISGWGQQDDDEDQEDDRGR